MVPTGSCTISSGLHKMAAKAKLPSSAVQRSLSPKDLRLLHRRLSEQVECVFDARFMEDGCEETLIFPLQTAFADSNSQVGGNDDSGVNWLSTNRGTSWSTDQEKHMFLRLNYCRFRVMRVVEEYADKRLAAEAVAEFLRWEHLASETREEIVRINMPLVLAMAKRTRITGVDYSDLISEGNLALLRSVDKFDCSRGFKFSTYACRSILKSFSRVASRMSRHRGRFPMEFDPTLEKSDHIEKKRVDVEDDCVDELKSILTENLANLSEVERQVIRARFALDALAQEAEPRGQTLEQVGELIGVTKERVRQIQNKALGKLRHVLEGGILSA